MVRLAWRALRETSEWPRLLLSSSSSTIIGMKTACSGKRNRHEGSCIKTLVSKTIRRRLRCLFLRDIRNHLRLGRKGKAAHGAALGDAGKTLAGRVHFTGL